MCNDIRNESVKLSKKLENIYLNHPLIQTREQKAACDLIISSLPQGELGTKYIKWANKKQDTFKKFLIKREKLDLRRKKMLEKRAKKKLKKQQKKSKS